MINMLARREKAGRRARTSRQGAALIETALVLPILLLLTFGLVECGYFFFVQHSLKGAASAGVRAAIVGGATNTDVTNKVDAVMGTTGISSTNYTVTTSPSDVSTAATGANVTVTVTCNWGTVGIRPMGVIASSKTLTGASVMQKEQ